MRCVSALICNITQPLTHHATPLRSHPQVDLGLLALFMAALSQELEVSMFAYDYSGYGESTGKAREANLYADMRAAVECMHERFGIPLNRIILYGQSIGPYHTRTHG